MIWARGGVGDRTTTQTVHSLRLLPSGPDRVGEGPARRRPPTALYQVPASPRQVSPRGGSQYRPSAAKHALGLDIERVDRLAARHEHAVALAAAETEIG